MEREKISLFVSLSAVSFSLYPSLSYIQEGERETQYSGCTSRLSLLTFMRETRRYLVISLSFLSMIGRGRHGRTAVVPLFPSPLYIQIRTNLFLSAPMWINVPLFLPLRHTSRTEGDREVPLSPSPLLPYGERGRHLYLSPSPWYMSHCTSLSL